MPAKEKAIEDKKYIGNVPFEHFLQTDGLSLKKNPYNSYWDYFPARIGVNVFEIRVGNYF